MAYTTSNDHAKELCGHAAVLLNLLGPPIPCHDPDIAPDIGTLQDRLRKWSKMEAA
jgi:hypothetical protein